MLFDALRPCCFLLPQASRTPPKHRAQRSPRHLPPGRRSARLMPEAGEARCARARAHPRRRRLRTAISAGDLPQRSVWPRSCGASSACGEYGEEDQGRSGMVVAPPWSAVLRDSRSFALHDTVLTHGLGKGVYTAQGVRVRATDDVVRAPAERTADPHDGCPFPGGLRGLPLRRHRTNCPHPRAADS